MLKPERQPTKGEVKGTKMGSKDEDNKDFSIEFYAKTRSEPVSSYDHGDAEFADILFGFNSFDENSNEIKDIHVLNNRDFNQVIDEKEDSSSGSNCVLEKKQSLNTTKQLNMWGMIHQHMVSGLSANSGDMIVQSVDEEHKSEAKDFDDDDANQETEIRKMFAVKLVRDAIEKILLPEIQDDQSTTSEVISEQDLSETSDLKEEFPAPFVEEKPAKKTEKEAPDRWSYLKKVILLKGFVKELENIKKFNPKKPGIETTSLRRLTTGDKKSSEEWMLDYALQKVVRELTPTQKRKVALLVKAFETVAPAQDGPQDPRSNNEVQWAGSEPKGESKPDLEKQQEVKMWHMIYQHVVTDIVKKIEPDMLVDRKDSTNSEESEKTVLFTKSDAVKLVRASVDEIISYDTESIASNIASGQEQASSQKDNDGSVTKLQQQNSINWGKLKKLIMLKRSIKALEGFRKLALQTREHEILNIDHEHERVDLRRQMIDERKKAEQWMLDYAVQHIVTKLTPARKMRVSMLVEAFEAVVPFPEY